MGKLQGCLPKMLPLNLWDRWVLEFHDPSRSFSVPRSSARSGLSIRTVLFVDLDMGSSKKVTLLVLSREQSEGVGARVRRSIGRPELKNLDPFLLFDEFKGGRPGGFPDHPHRGFETVSYLLEGGSMAHEDFCGHRGKMNPGDLQWMTAGRGILHAEMPCSEEPAHGLQLWVNLKSSEKMVEPRYQELKSEEIPKPSKDGVTVAVISGEALGIKSKIYTRTPTLYLDFKLDQGAKHSQPIPEGWTSFIYTISGDVYIGSCEKPFCPNCWGANKRTSCPTWSICDEHQ
ncbi:pirin isoform X2 [Heterocephalus glaber]|uniref:Pirin n=2 Tax=Heterocephalus glaber TaxID=10181 RepID=A0AAX6RT91_HETGA|nr:pirin isoform X2 [Heterocephalus glaber]